MPTTNIQTPGVYINEPMANSLLTNEQAVLPLFKELVKGLNRYLKATFNVNEDLATLGILAMVDGTVSPAIENKVILQLVELKYGVLAGKNTIIVALLVTANFREPTEAIQQLTKTAEFFRMISPQGTLKGLGDRFNEVQLSFVEKSAVE
jgi:hypothetical protein